MDDLHDRVCLVTGSSRGIGRAVALRLAQAGAHVAVGYSSHPQAAAEVVAAIRRIGPRATAVEGDMADPVMVRAVVSATIAELGPVDVLVANAGIGPRAELEEIDLDSWDRVLDVNLRAPFLLAQALVPQMRDRGFGRIVFMSSVAAFTGGILGAHYTASKAGLIGLTHALARPLAPHGITVNAIAPALVETDMVTGNPAVGQRLAASIPVGRLGRAEEVADLVLAVVTNAYLNGQTISVDGGLYPR